MAASPPLLSQAPPVSSDRPCVLLSLGAASVLPLWRRPCPSFPPQKASLSLKAWFPDAQRGHLCWHSPCPRPLPRGLRQLHLRASCTRVYTPHRLVANGCRCHHCPAMPRRWGWGPPAWAHTPYPSNPLRGPRAPPCSVLLQEHGCPDSTSHPRGYTWFCASVSCRPSHPTCTPT